MNGTEPERETEFYPEGINDGREFTRSESQLYRRIEQHFNHNNKSTKYKTLLAFTWSPSDATNKYVRHSEQYYNVSPQLSGILRASTDYFIIPEFNLRQKIHYHGIIGIKDYVKWSKSTYFSLYHKGMLRVKPIDNMMKWICYFIKDYTLNSALLGTRIWATEDNPHLPRNPINKVHQRYKLTEGQHSYNLLFNLLRSLA